MVLRDIAEALLNVNDKVDAIAQVIGPTQDAIKQALANSTYERDLIIQLMDASSRNLAKMEAESYAKYIEGMTALGAKQGISAAQQFKEALNRVNMIAPNDFLPEVVRKHKEIEAWQGKVEGKMRYFQKTMQEIRNHVEKFQEMAGKYEKEAILTLKEMKNGVAVVKTDVENSILDEKAKTQKHLGDIRKTVKEEAASIIKKNNIDVQAEVSRVKEALDIPNKLRDLKDEVNRVTQDTKLQILDEVDKLRKDKSLDHKTKELREEMKRFEDFADNYKSDFNSAAKLASLQMQKAHKEVRDVLKDQVNDVKNKMAQTKSDLTAECVGALAKAKVDMSAQLERAVSDLNQSVADMEANKKNLEALAKQAGENIMETQRVIAKNSNSRPRNQRGRRNN